MTGRSSTTIRAGHSDHGYLVRVEGRGTLHESPDFKQYVSTVLENERSELTVDLSTCSYLDSTFLGCLAGLHKRFNSPNTVRFQVAVSAEHAQTLFAATRLHTFLPLVHDVPAFVGTCVCLDAKAKNAKELGCVSAECHRQLADLGGPQERIFRAIADQLERELHEEVSPSGT